MRSFLLAAGLMAAVPLGAQPAGPAAVPEIHADHFFYGYPTGTPITNDLVVRRTHALSSNDSTRFADWVAYRLTAQEVAGTLPLDRPWRPDPWLDADETLEPADYAGAYDASGYQRGHLAPLASFKGTVYAGEVNALSNIVPQSASLNRGPWGTLEAAERDLVLRRAWLDPDRAAVYVLAGTLYERPMPPLPRADEPHAVPSGFWKVVAVQNGPGPASVVVAAFVFDQCAPGDGAGCDEYGPDDEAWDFLVSVDEVERRTGLDLLRLLPDPVEAALESTTGAADLLFPNR